MTVRSQARHIRGAFLLANGNTPELMYTFVIGFSSVDAPTAAAAASFGRDEWINCTAASSDSVTPSPVSSLQSIAIILVTAIVPLLHLVPHAAVLARLGTVLLARVQLNVLDRVAQRAAPAVTHCHTAGHLYDRYLSDPQLGVAAVAVQVLNRSDLHVKRSELAL